MVVIVVHMITRFVIQPEVYALRYISCGYEHTDHNALLLCFVD